MSPGRKTNGLVARLDWRAFLLATAVLLAILYASASYADRLTVWRALGVPAILDHPFADTRVVTSSWDCSRLGYDVLATNPCDYADRPMNYPRLWLLPGFLGLGESSTRFVGIAIDLGFLLAFLACVGRLKFRETIVYALALASPSVLLGVERGNVDLVVFAICALGLLLMQSPTTWRRVMATVALVAATALKFYPLFAFAALFTRIRSLVLALAALAVYFLLTFKDMLEIYRVTPQSSLLSYGTLPVGDLLGVSRWIVAAGLIVATVSTAIMLRARLSATTATTQLGEDAFLLGVATYVGSFLIGANWDYRLVFLLFTLPHVIALLRLEAARKLGATLLAEILALLWLSRNPAQTNAAFQIVSAILFVQIGALALALWLRRASEWHLPPALTGLRLTAMNPHGRLPTDPLGKELLGRD
jgi:hypothetical protein